MELRMKLLGGKTTNNGLWGSLPGGGKLSTTRSVCVPFQKYSYRLLVRHAVSSQSAVLCFFGLTKEDSGERKTVESLHLSNGQENFIVA